MTSLAATLNSTNVRNLALFAWNRLALRVAAAFSRERAVERAARLFATPPRHAHTPPEVELLRGGQGFVVSVGFHRIAAWRFGDAARPAIVFSHGWGGRGAQFRRFVSPLVARGFQVVLFDHEGHGYSEGRESSLVQFEKGIEAVVAALERDGVRVHGFVGHSLGAAAIGTYLNRTRRAARAVLVAPPTSVVRYSTLFARRFGLPEEIRRAMQERFEHRLGRRWQEFELPQCVANVAAPALVIHDEEDREVPPASGAALAQAWRGARLLRTRGLGHRAVLRAPAAIDSAIDFLTQP